MNLSHDSVKVEKAFKEQQSFSKEDLVESFTFYMEYVQVNEENYTQKSVAEKLKLCKMFLEKLNKCKLPNITEDWWYYEYGANRDSISLSLCKADEDNIELDDDGNISTISLIDEKDLFEVECRYVSVNEFAEIKNVKPATVLQWVHRGRLRYIKQSEDGWAISACENKPTKITRALLI